MVNSSGTDAITGSKTILAGYLPFAYYTAIPNFTIHPYYFSWQKRAFDICVSVFALFLLWPVLLLVMLAIFLSSGSPIFFSQLRTGKNKKIFLIWKFRSMKVGAEKEKSRLKKLNQAPWPMFKAYDDPRYTKIGHFLSLTGIDEVPQIWNILKGEMSIVGPRPLPVNESKKLEKEWDFRYEVLPGIISEWAVDPKRYQSLAKWKKLEKETVKKGGLIYDFILIKRTLSYLTK